PPFLELRQDPLGVVLVVRRTEMMRPRAHPLHVVADVLRIRDGTELRIPGGVLRRDRKRDGGRNDESEHEAWCVYEACSVGTGFSRPSDHLLHLFPISCFVFQTFRTHGTA